MLKSLIIPMNLIYVHNSKETFKNSEGKGKFQNASYICIKGLCCANIKLVLLEVMRLLFKSIWALE
jgi:hypothetical protein